MLQDIAPHTYHVEFTPAEPQPADLLLIYGPQGVRGCPASAGAR